MKIRYSALIGMGAIGTVYAKPLHEKYGDAFAVIAGGGRGEKLKTEGATLNGSNFHPRVISPNDRNFRADLVIFCVKNHQLDAAIEDARNFIGKETVILPLLNGISAMDKLSSAFPGNKVCYGLTIRIDAVRDFDGVTNSKNGIIQFGDAKNDPPAQDVICASDYLSAAGIETQVCADMMRATWYKWMLNVGGNQVSAVTGANYGQLMGIESNRLLMREVMAEVIALAEVLNIDLSEADILEQGKILSSLSPAGKTSMLQDVEAHRRTEVDCFAGTVVKLGKKLNVPTPANHILYHIIRAREALYLK